MSTVHDGTDGSVSVEFDGLCTLLLSNNDTVAEIRLLDVQGHSPTLLVPRSPMASGTPDAVVVVDGIECGVWSLANCLVTVNTQAPLSVDVSGTWTSILKLVQLAESGKTLAAAAPAHRAAVNLTAGHLSAVEPDAKNKAAEFVITNGGVVLSAQRAYASMISWALPAATGSTVELQLTSAGGSQRVHVESGFIARITNLCFQTGRQDVLQHYRMVGLDPSQLQIDKVPPDKPLAVWPYHIDCGAAVYRS